MVNPQISPQLQKLTVIGNAGGGKTTLSRKLSSLHQLPLTHVDTIQFLPGMKVRPLDDTRGQLIAITAQEKWLVDGFGPLDLIEKRFALADRVIMIDFPIWRHFWWCAKRQLKSLWSPRAELIKGANEATLAQTIKLYKSIWKVHHGMRPELLRILNRPAMKPKVIFVNNLEQWQNLFENGIS